MLDCSSLNEYLKLVDVVGNFDARLLTVKSWGVTLSLVALGLGFKEKAWGYFLLAMISGLAFWTIEYKMKGHQISYYVRMAEIEHACYKLAQAEYSSLNADQPVRKEMTSAEYALLAPRVDWSWHYANRLLRGLEMTKKEKKRAMTEGITDQCESDFRVALGKKANEALDKNEQEQMSGECSKISPEFAILQDVEMKRETEYYKPWQRWWLAHVMMPHLLSVVFGLFFTVLAFFKIGRFRDYGD